MCREQELAAKMQQDLVNLSADKAASAATLQAAEDRLQAALKDQETTAAQLQAAQEAVLQLQVMTWTVASFSRTHLMMPVCHLCRGIVGLSLPCLHAHHRLSTCSMCSLVSIGQRSPAHCMDGMQEQGQRAEQVMRAEMAAAAADQAAVQDRCACMGQAGIECIGVISPGSQVRHVECMYELHIHEPQCLHSGQYAHEMHPPMPQS